MLCFIRRKTGQYQRVNVGHVAACGMRAAVPTSQIKLSDWSGFQPANQRSLSCDIGTATFTRIYIFLGNIGEINKIHLSLIYCDRGKQCVLLARDRRCCPTRSRGQQRRSMGHKTPCFPEVSVNKCFCQSMNNSPVIGVNLI